MGEKNDFLGKAMEKLGIGKIKKLDEEKNESRKSEYVEKNKFSSKSKAEEGINMKNKSDVNQEDTNEAEGDEMEGKEIEEYVAERDDTEGDEAEGYEAEGWDTEGDEASNEADETNGNIYKENKIIEETDGEIIIKALCDEIRRLKRS